MGVLITASVKTGLWSAGQAHTNEGAQTLCCSFHYTSSMTVPRRPPAKQEMWLYPKEVNHLRQLAEPAGGTSYSGEVKGFQEIHLTLIYALRLCEYCVCLAKEN